MSQKVTPQNCGADEIACNIVNRTFLELDGFAPLRKQLDASGTNGTFTFACSLARVVHRELIDGLNKSVDRLLKS